MKRILHHLIIPAVVPAVFFIVAAMPVEVMGCRNRGLTAMAIALLGGLAGVGTAVIGAWGRMRGDPNSSWWMVSALILAIPAVVIVAMA